MDIVIGKVAVDNMGKVAVDIVIGTLVLSILVLLASTYLPWGGCSSANPLGIHHAKYYLLSVIVEPKAELSQRMAQMQFYNSHRITCPWATDGAGVGGTVTATDGAGVGGRDGRRLWRNS